MSPARFARRSCGPDYLCTKPWPADCFVQCGGDGIVFTTKGGLEGALSDAKQGAAAVVATLGGPAPAGSYRTAFFEAFPRSPKTFLRGEGATIEEAEAKAWAALERYRACPKHIFHRKGYTNGAGFCRRCRLFKSKAFKPFGRCRYNCGRPMYSQDKAGKGYCKRHNYANPDRLMETDRRGRVLRDEHGFAKFRRSGVI